MTTREKIIEADRKHVWRPYTSSEDHLSMDPLVIDRSEGPYLFDVDGRRYIDGNSSWWTCVLGHGHPRLRHALASQAERMMHVPLAGVTHEPAAVLAEELTGVAPPGLTRVFYSDNGSTAVEAAVKMAVQFWHQQGASRKTKFLPLPGSFHGDTVGAMSVGGVAAFHDTFRELTFSTIRVDEPTGDDWSNTMAQMREALRSNKDEIAAVVIEPLVQGASGMRFVPPHVIKELEELARSNGVLLICDEVFVGYGRLGTMWASELADVTPDIMCVGKGFAGGVLPFAATLASERVFDGFRGDKTRAFMHGHTFCGNPLGAAVALEVLRVFKDENVLATVTRNAEQLSEGMDSLRETGGVSGVRTCGMVAACEVNGGGGYLGKAGWSVYQEALRRGIYARPLGNTVYLTPPINIETEVLALLLDGFVASVQAVCSRPST